MKKIGFTGTQHGMKDRQRDTLLALLRSASPDVFIHGDCIGADFEAQYLIKKFVKESVIWIYPPDNDSKRAFCTANLINHPLPYLERNKLIVDNCTELIACPTTMEEMIRSGTWSTIRYARKIKKPYTIVFLTGEAKSYIP